MLLQHSNFIVELRHHSSIRSYVLTSDDDGDDAKTSHLLTCTHEHHTNKKKINSDLQNIPSLSLSQSVWFCLPFSITHTQAVRVILLSCLLNHFHSTFFCWKTNKRTRKANALAHVHMRKHVSQSTNTAIFSRYVNFGSCTSLTTDCLGKRKLCLNHHVCMCIHVWSCKTGTVAYSKLLTIIRAKVI